MMVDWDDIKCLPLAGEIYRKFWRKMAQGGEIDRVLNGAEPIEKRQPESDEEIALRKKQIEIQLAEYEAALNLQAQWFNEWKARQPKGFRRAKTGAT